MSVSKGFLLQGNTVMIERIDHVNLVVQNLSAMVEFYERAFGLRTTKRATICGPWIEAVTGYADVEADVVYLEADTNAGIELIQYHTPEGSRPDGLGEPNTKGIRHLAFRIRNFDSIVDTLENAGVELLSEIQTVAGEQVDYGNQRKRLVYCRDPEGNLLELCSYE
jgi:catechol 2,3-dioxygenase-like lactoylglutathione lyase family enzyme